MKVIYDPYVCIYIYIYTHTHTYIHTHKHMHMHAYGSDGWENAMKVIPYWDQKTEWVYGPHTHAHTHTHSYTWTYRRAYVHWKLNSDKKSQKVMQNSMVRDKNYFRFPPCICVCIYVCMYSHNTQALLLKMLLIPDAEWRAFRWIHIYTYAWMNTCIHTYA